MLTILNRLSSCLIVMALVAVMATAVTGCRCLNGQEVVIPSADATPPSVVMDFHLPSGDIVTVTPGSTTSVVPVPGGGKVTVIVNAADSEGVQDAQIWAADITSKTDPITGLTSVSGPGLLTFPSASNPDNGSPGQNGCTERVVSQNLQVSSTPRKSVSYQVIAHGKNFGGADVSTPIVTLQAGCLNGQEVVIPSTDGTPPSLAMDFRLPNGNTITVTPGSTTSIVPVPGGGKVTVTVNAKDSEGVQDVQIWAAEIVTTIDPVTGAATGGNPGTLGQPTARSLDKSSPGQKGCTERIVSQTLEVRSTPQGSVAFQVTAHGKNFGGADVATPIVRLVAQ